MLCEKFAQSWSKFEVSKKPLPVNFFKSVAMSSDEERSTSATGRIGFLAGLFSTKDSVLLSDSESLSLKALAFFDPLRHHFLLLLDLHVGVALLRITWLPISGSLTDVPGSYATLLILITAT